MTRAWIFAILAIGLIACTATDDARSVSNESEAGLNTLVQPPSAELGVWGVDLSTMDASVDPGDDFFRYVNGTWLSEFEIPADRSRYGSFTVLTERSENQVRTIIEEMAAAESDAGSVQQQVGDYYASAMDVERVNELGMDPIAGELARISAISNYSELVRAFGESNRIGSASPIQLRLEIDRQNPDRYVAGLVHSGLSLPERDFYLDDSEQMAETRAAFEAHVAEMLAFVDPADAQHDAAEILELETRIAEHHWPRADRRNRDLTYNLTQFEDLDALYSGFDWQGFFSAAGYVPEDLNVVHPSAIAPLVEVVRSTPIATWKAYLTYKLVSNWSGVLPEAVDQANFDFYGRTLRGQPQQPPRWRDAINLVAGRNGLGEAVSQIYVERHFPEDSKRKMAELVANVRAAMGKRIEELDWMSDATKGEASAKLATFRPKIGYPDRWQDFSSIVIKRDDLAGNARRVAEFYYADLLSRFGKPTDKDEWFMTPHTVNAYYNPQFNEIVFPAAILQPPFFDPHADPAVNYGGIGAVIGHEIGHGFDDQGSKSDANGIQRNWWTKDDRARFEARTANLVEQYSGYEGVPGTFLDGRFTLGENIGDLGGLAVAYEAYQLSLDGKPETVIDGFTGTQRFFLSYGQIWRLKAREEAKLSQIKSDPHSLPEFRVNGVVRNHDAWYEAFGVNEDEALYLPTAERVSIW